MQKRRRFKLTTSLQDRLSVFVAEARVEVDRAPARSDPFERRVVKTAASVAFMSSLR